MPCALRVRSLVLQKADCDRSECEDSIGIRRAAHRFCVADGATEAFDSRRWARLLTKYWVSSIRPLLTRDQFALSLSQLGRSFQEHWATKQLSWYAEEKARSGAFSTFLGIQFFEESMDHLSWQAIAIGDSCLIHLRDGLIRSSFPLTDSSEFGYHPMLFPSDVGRQESAIEHIVIRDGLAQIGDVFLLLTDAIAAWYLEAMVTNPDRARAFERSSASPDDGEAFELIAAARADGSLRNDDIAVIRIEIGYLDLDSMD